jgi:hypothetical protein
MVLNPIIPVLDKWNKAHEKGPVRLYDFGDGQSVMPQMDADGSWLTRSVCFLYLQGTKPLELHKLPSENEKAFDLGDGWIFYPIQIGYLWTEQELFEALNRGEAALLKILKEEK